MSSSNTCSRKKIGRKKRPLITYCCVTNLRSGLEDLSVLSVIEVSAENSGRVHGGDSVGDESASRGGDHAHLMIVAVDEVGQKSLGVDLKKSPEMKVKVQTPVSCGRDDIYVLLPE